MLVSASLALDSAGVRHAFFAETFMSASGQAAFFGNVAPLVDFFLTTPPANFIAVPQPDGTTVQMVNGGIGKVEFVPEPASLVLFGAGLAAAVLYGRAKALVRDGQM
jgi:PEP-CTERM motif